MTISEVKQEVKRVMEEHGEELDFPVVESKGISELGSTWYLGTKVAKITISKSLLKYGDEDDILDTIYHECAHALVTKKTGELHKHDRVWKQMAIECGARPERTSKILRDYGNKAYKYHIVCPTCGDVKYYHARKGKWLSEVLFQYCPKCKTFLEVRDNKGNVVLESLGVVPESMRR